MFIVCRIGLGALPVLLTRSGGGAPAPVVAIPSMLGAGASAAAAAFFAPVLPPLTIRGAGPAASALSAADELELGAEDVVSSEAESVSCTALFFGVTAGCKLGEDAAAVGFGADAVGNAGRAPLGFFAAAGATGAEATGVGTVAGSLVCPLNWVDPTYRAAPTIAAAATPNRIFLLAPLDFSGRLDPPNVNVGSDPIAPAGPAWAASAGFS